VKGANSKHRTHDNRFSTTIFPRIQHSFLATA
jgi:hypothetical protein